MKHFKLTDETLDLGRVKLRRIEATVDLPKHGVRKGDKGGWVEKEAQVYGNAWVSGNAQVYGDARVSGNAQVSGDAWVSGNAHIDCLAAIICIIVAQKWTVTVTPQNVSIGCQLFSRKEVRAMTEADAENRGLPREMYGPYRKMILAAMKLVKPKKAPARKGEDRGE